MDLLFQTRITSDLTLTLPITNKLKVNALNGPLKLEHEVDDEPTNQHLTYN